MARRMKIKRKCVVCGKEFTPNCPIQKTCSQECRKANNYSKHREWISEHPENWRRYPKKQSYKPTGKCKICGQLIIQEQGMMQRRTTQMHDECVLRDCAATLARTEKLSKMQFLRLQARGWTLTEFREEYKTYV